MLEKSKRLRGQAKHPLRFLLARQCLGKLRQLRADAALFVGGVDLQAGQLGLLFFGVRLQRDDADDVIVDLEDEMLVDLFFDEAAGALEQLLALNGRLINAMMWRMSLRIAGRIAWYSSV